MLVLPPQATPLRVLGIDPGTTTMGIAVLDWDLESPVIDVATAFTLVANDRQMGYQSTADLHGSRVARLQLQADLVRGLLYDFRPHVVIAEAPFMGRFAQSFSALVECVQTIRGVLFEYDPHMPFNLIDPPSVKKAVGVAKGKMSDKEDVRRALSEQPDLRWHVNLSDLDEHSVDAVAIARYYLRQVL